MGGRSKPFERTLAALPEAEVDTRSRAARSTAAGPCWNSCAAGKSKSIRGVESSRRDARRPAPEMLVASMRAESSSPRSSNPADDDEFTETVRLPHSSVAALRTVSRDASATAQAIGCDRPAWSSTRFSTSSRTVPKRSGGDEDGGGAADAESEDAESANGQVRASRSGQVAAAMSG